MMKNLTVAVVLALGGCTSVPSVPWMQGPEVTESACTAACDAHFEQCPQIFAGFAERGAIECPAEHNHCLQSCATRRPAATASPQAMSGTVRAVSSKEERLRELKHLYDEGLVTDDVYRDRQKAILSEP
ncbi:MAG: hypothetical protein JWL65_3358 [Gammaproteobacteria bacterium]|nr:hypothetical protein [Gammaproteobacteria bacterium]